MTDFDNASRGFIGTLESGVIKTQAGRLAWNNNEYDFVQRAKCPDSVHPKLWRQAQLCNKHGLFEVAPGVYQVRGFDLSNMTLVEGQKGVIIIDPLISNECAAAAFSLYKKHRGERPLTGLIYSHSHVDHFGGARGVLPEGMENDIPIIAPEGFMEEATSENIYVGTAMRRRARFMYGSSLPRNPEGQVGCGLGMATSQGTTSLIPPNMLIATTGEERVIDGVRIEFQIVSGTEAPSEFNFYFLDSKALYISECATHCMHNIITLRGALVRDSKAWSQGLDESLVLFGDRATVLFAGHHWPTWGQRDISRLLVEQRDMYAFMHDQTVRLMNEGLTGVEIAEKLSLPPTLDKAWHIQGYYGSLSHNIKAIYQRYMTWFDGNPVNLWRHTPTEEGKRYVACMGGADRTVAFGNEYAAKGDLRFAATLLGHVVAAEPKHPQARKSLSAVFTKLGHGAVNATWRNFYLTGAMDLQQEATPTLPPGDTVPGLNPLMSVDQWLSGISVQIDGPRAAREDIVIDIKLTDQSQTWRLTLSNGALTYRMTSDDAAFTGGAGLHLTVTKEDLGQLLLARIKPEAKVFKGNPKLFHKLLQFLPWANSLESQL
jgi:alkyl sulfatase BDS1-like metallo-beta-lactamase superfamily hydrolase